MGGLVCYGGISMIRDAVRSSRATPPQHEVELPEHGPVEESAEGFTKDRGPWRSLAIGVTLVASVAGTIVCGWLIVTEFARIVENPAEDGILPAFLYFALVAFASLGSVRPSVPKAFQLIAALANTAAVIFVAFLWAALFSGQIDSGSEFVVPLVTIGLIIVLIGTDYFELARVFRRRTR
jgi:hypothetical protein